MSRYDLMKLFDSFDGEISEGDFTPEELEEYLSELQGRGELPSDWKEKYFAYYDDIKDKSLKKQDW